MLILSKVAQDQIVAHARSGLPNEACGLLAGLVQGEEKTVLGIYCLKNIDQSPEHFSMAPEDQFKAIQEIRKKGWTLLGNFHSHPSTPSRPSPEDIRLAFDPSLSYVIVSFAAPEPALKSFLISKGLAAEEPIRQ
jgi:proteasome lid subunit RPN8/RPN11